jgi:hypothetical protein
MQPWMLESYNEGVLTVTAMNIRNTKSMNRFTISNNRLGMDQSLDPNKNHALKFVSLPGAVVARRTPYTSTVAPIQDMVLA